MNNKIYIEMTDEDYEIFKKMKRGELIDVEQKSVVDLLTIKCGKGTEKEDMFSLNKYLVFNTKDLTITVKKWQGGLGE